MYEQLSIQTRQRIQFLDITDRVQTLLHRQRAKTGVVTLFCPHTTAGITINENADPAVCRDLIETLSRLVPANQNYFTHMEGNSDAHVKSSLMGVSLQVLVLYELHVGCFTDEGTFAAARARLPPRLTRFTPRLNRVGASMVLARPATMFSGPGIAAARRRMVSALGTAGTNTQSAPASR